ncbi:hypothetical protein D9M70_241310 [compost metagenome]
MLGGVPIVLHAAAPVETIEVIGGWSMHRLSGGAAVKQTHWDRHAGSISAEGFMPPGLDGLDYSLPLELRSTKVQSIVGSGLVFTLTSTPRPDSPAWAEGLIGRQWVRTPVAVDDGVATVTALADATLYRCCWRPVFSVFAQKPAESQDNAVNMHSWSLNWEEA